MAARLGPVTRHPTLSWPQVRARRMARHALLEPVTSDRAVEIAGAICGVHAQVMSAAETSLGIRVAGITRADVRRALWEDRSLVKTIGPRGTVHLIAAKDLATWNATLDAALEPPGFALGVRLDADQTAAVVAAIGEALAGRDLTLDELDAEVPRLAGAWAGDRVMPAFQELWPRWRQALRPAAARGVLCFGPSRGRTITYTSPRRWVRGYTPADSGRAALDALTLFLRAYGPALPGQFGRWLGASPSWAQELFARAGDRVERVDVEGDELWQLAGDEAPDAADTTGIVRLLPYFDAYAVGSHPRERLFEGPALERAVTRGQAGNIPVLLADGVVAGVWHAKRAGNRLAITVEPLRRLRAPELRELEAQVERVGEIQEAAASLTVGTVTAGPHA
jgi:winged helix DNA-binding protein